MTNAIADRQNPPRRYTAARRAYQSSKCAVCRHSDRWRIELLKAGGAGIDALAKKFDVSRDSIDRHWRNHVTAEAKAGYLCGPAELATLAERAAIEGDSVLDYLRLCRTVLVGQLSAMSEAGDGNGAANVARALTRTLEAIARVTGELGETPRDSLWKRRRRNRSRSNARNASVARGKNRSGPRNYKCQR